jgi:hypothetical protein
MILVIFRKLKKTCQIFGANFFRNQNNVLILIKNELGNILGHFFTNSSGHPDPVCLRLALYIPDED